MEALGAIGLARVFHIGGRIGADLFHPDDPFGESRALDDVAYSLDHFRTKILTLPDRMNTAAGKIVAQQRTLIIDQFLACLMHEIAPDSPLE